MKLGKLPARKDSIKFKLRDYLPMVSVPSKAGHQTLVIDWEGILGNDLYGDCVWAGADHETILWSRESGLQDKFSADTALSDYSTVTGFNKNEPSTDNGTDMQVAASYRRKTGIVDISGNRHRVLAYLSITPGNKAELKQAIYLFSNVGIGIEFPASAMTQFNQGKTWTVTKSKIEGGHYVPAVGYDSRYVYVITWGKVQKMTWGFFSKYCDEAVVYLDTEFLTAGKSPEGFNAMQLKADLGKL